MAMERSYVLFLCLASLLGHNEAQLCADIDPTACKLMASQRPDLCTDPALSKSACPRFCNLCPVECYNCNTTMQDYHMCNSTMLCGEGEVCMRKELHSFNDGHAEYELTCENKAVCDGSNLVFNFGKRSPQVRDVSVHCCAEDLCNYPKQVLITNCGKDILFMVDRSVNTLRNGEASNLISFLFKVVNNLSIGPDDNLVGLTEYDVRPHTQWELNTYNDVYDVLRAVQSLNFHNLPSHFQLADTDSAIQFIVQHALTPAVGDRPDHKDAVVLIASADNARRLAFNLKSVQQLHQLSNDIIVISVGQNDPFHSLDNIATDNNHVFHVSDYSMLDGSMVSNVLRLLKEC